MARAMFFVLGSVLFLAGCDRALDLDQTSPNAVSKKLLNGEWYLRSALVEKQAHNGLAFSGLECATDRIRFQITRDKLLAFRSYEKGAEGKESHRDQTLVAAFVIEKHFDITRESHRGARHNVISENSRSRPWWQRDYMRVDWSENLAPHEDCNQWVQSVTKLSVPHNSDANPTDPFRVRISDDYIESTMDALVESDQKTCERINEWNCSPAQFRIKYSFRKILEQNDYTSRVYPDFMPIRYGENGYGLCLENEPGCADVQELWLHPGQRKTEICDPSRHNIANCIQIKVDMNAQFGFFRSETQKYDQLKGYAKDARVQLINRHNIWQKSKREDGSVIPLSDRIAKKVIYYLNVGFPKELIPATKRVADEWSLALANVVARVKNQCTPEGAQAYIEQNELWPQLKLLGFRLITPENLSEICSQLAKMPLAKGAQEPFFKGNPEQIISVFGPLFEIRINDCNADRILAYAQKHNLMRELSEHGLSAPTDANLEQACAVLEWASHKKRISPAFDWQRLGDLRYNFVNGVSKAEEVRLLGYGPSAKDPFSGEIISASANVYLAAVNQYAALSIDLMDEVKKQSPGAPKTQTEMPTKNGLVKPFKMDESFARFNETVEDSLRKSSEKGPKAQLASRLSLNLAKLTPEGFSEETEAGLTQGGMPHMGHEGKRQVFEALFEDLLQEPKTLKKPKKKDTHQSLVERLNFYGERSACFLHEAWENPYGLLEKKLKGASFDEKFAYLRERIFEAVLKHEIGHTFGLRHNYKGAYDFLNFPPNVSGVNTGDFRMRPDLDKSEMRSSSIMDYHLNFNSDFAGLGLYDYAAMLSGYGEQIEVFDESKEAFVPRDWYDQLGNLHYQDLAYVFAGGSVNEKLNQHYKKVQDAYLLGDANAYLDPKSLGVAPRPENLYRRKTVPFSELPRLVFEKTLGLTDKPRFYQVPYAYCSDGQIGGIDIACSPFIMGSSAEEIVSYAINSFEQGYYFKSRKGQNLNLNIGSYLSSTYNKLYNPILKSYQYMYYFRKGPHRIFPMARDFTKAAQLGLEFIGKVLQTPEPGTYCLDEQNNYVPMAKEEPCKEPITIDERLGRHYYSNLGSDGNTLSSIGFIYDKIMALMAICDDRSLIAHPFSRLPQNHYAAGYYRLFPDELSNLLSSYFQNDWSVFAPSIKFDKAKTPILNYRRLIDLKSGEGADGNLPKIKPTSSWAQRYYAILFSMAGLSNHAGQIMDFAKRSQIKLLGGEKMPLISSHTESIVFTDPTTHLRYVSSAPEGIDKAPGFRLLKDARDFVSGGVNGGEDGSWYKAKQALLILKQKMGANGVAADDDLEKAYKNAARNYEKQNRILHQKVHVIDLVRKLSDAFADGT